MTLTLTAAQQATLRSLGISGVNPRWWAQIQTGVTQEFTVGGAGDGIGGDFGPDANFLDGAPGRVLSAAPSPQYAGGNTTAATFVFRLRRTAASTGNIIYDQNNATIGDPGFIQIQHFETNQVLRFQVESFVPNWVQWASSGIGAGGVFAIVAFVFNAGSVTAYVDGADIGAPTGTQGSMPSTLGFSQDTEARIGNAWDGDFSEFLFFRRALNASEVASLGQTGTFIVQAAQQLAPTSWVRFGDAGADTLTDLADVGSAGSGVTWEITSGTLTAAGVGAGQTITVEGTITSQRQVTMQATHQPESAIAGIGDAAETAANIAEAFNSYDDLAAWSLGTRVWVRVDHPNDVDITPGGSALGVSVFDAGSSSPPYEFVSGPDPIEGIDASLLDAGSVAQEKDRTSNQVTGAQREIRLQWTPTTEDMIRRNVLIGRAVVIRRGSEDHAIADWVPSGTWVIVDGPFPFDLGTFRPGDREQVGDFPPHERPPLTLVLEDRVQWLLSRARTAKTSEGDYRGQFYAQHPLLAIRTLLRLALIGSADAAAPSQLVDESSLDPSTSEWEDVSHLCVSQTDAVAWPIGRYADEYLRGGGGAGLLSAGRNGAITVFENGPISPTSNSRAGLQLEPGALRPKSTAEVDDNPAELLDQVLLLLPGQLVAEEDGVMRARRVGRSQIQAGTATIRDWSDHFVPTGLTEMRRDFFTRVIVEVGQEIEMAPSDVKLAQDYVIRDEASARAHQVRFARALEADRRFENLWLQQIGYLAYASPRDQLPTPAAAGGLYGGWGSQGSALTSSSTSLFVQVVGGFAGTAQEPVSYLAPGGLSVGPAWAQLSATRLAYLRLRSAAELYALDGLDPQTADRPSAQEVIACDSATPGPPPYNWQAVSAARTLDDLRVVSSLWEYGIAEREVEGEAPAAWLPGAQIADVTIARQLALDRLETNNWGYPTVEGYTTLGQLDVQIGDFVSVPLPHLIDFAGVGAAQLGLVFEVLGKVELRERVDWTLGLAGRETPYVFRTVYQPPPLITGVPWTPPEVSPYELYARATGEAVSTGTATGTIEEGILLAEASGSATASGAASPSIAPD